jgi:hypothetical protein
MQILSIEHILQPSPTTTVAFFPQALFAWFVSSACILSPLDRMHGCTVLVSTLIWSVVNGTEPWPRERSNIAVHVPQRCDGIRGLSNGPIRSDYIHFVASPELHGRLMP